MNFKRRTDKDHSSITSIAISGQLVWASQALSSRPAGTVPAGLEDKAWLAQTNCPEIAIEVTEE